MAVLVEAISVIIRVEAIHEKYPGGWQELQRHPPTKALCADNELVRVGFMTPQDTEAFVDRLESHGIIYLLGKKAVDLVVADQQRGFASECDWARLFRTSLDGDPRKQVLCCERNDTKCEEFMTPDGWVYEKSLSARFTFVETDAIPERMELLRRENGVDVYRDKTTGEIVYSGRTKDSPTGRCS